MTRRCCRASATRSANYANNPPSPPPHSTSNFTDWSLQRPVITRSPMTPVPEKSRILIADDNEPNVELLEAYLSGLDVQTAVAVDGQDTLDKVASFRPHLILLDIMMPKLSGFEVCKKLKNHPATS